MLDIHTSGSCYTRDRETDCVSVYWHCTHTDTHNAKDYKNPHDLSECNLVGPFCLHTTEINTDTKATVSEGLPDDAGCSPALPATGFTFYGGGERDAVMRPIQDLIQVRQVLYF